MWYSISHITVDFINKIHDKIYQLYERKKYYIDIFWEHYLIIFHNEYTFDLFNYYADNVVI